MKTFTRENTGIEVAEEFADRIEGKTVVITGASNNSLGSATAIAFAHGNPDHIVLLARSKAKVDPVTAAIKQLNPKIAVTFVSIDLDDLESVRKAAAEVNSAVSKIDILINNAGIMAIKDFTLSKQGIELQFAVNHVGHFLLTKLVWPKIAAAGPGARIVNLTSKGHEIGPCRFEDYNFQNGAAYDEWSGYGQSKTANILFSVALAQRLKDKGMFSYAVHPGGILETGLAHHIEDVMASLASITPVAERNTGRTFSLANDPMKTPEQGVTTTLIAALDPRIEDKSGCYMADAEPRPAFEYAVDKNNAEKLWTLSEKLIGEQFDI